jgi:alkanesulfonate monooxygenase SsuD/methylene tetrahydromethanopterin reductase-like flavin-dependent oxidoreductase (luciferase family)
MRMAASSAGTFKTVAEQGLPLFVGLRGDGLGALVDNINVYRETWRSAGHAGDGSVYLRVPVYAADTEASAFEEPRANITYYFERQARLVVAGRPKGGSAVRANTAATLSALSYDDILQDRVAFGTAAQLIERITEWRAVLGIDGITAELNAGGMLSEAQVKNSLHIIARDVMPAFK